MRINPECVRDIILTIEEVTDFNTDFQYPNDNYERLNSYSKNEMLTHLERCKDNQLFIGYFFYMNQSVSIEDLSPKGHSFADAIRSDTTWNKVKEKLKSTAGLAIPALVSLAIDYSQSKY